MKKYAIFAVFGIVLLLAISTAIFFNTYYTKKRNATPDVQSPSSSSTKNIKIDGNVEVWLTTTNQKNLLSPQQSLIPSDKDIESDRENVRSFCINPDKVYQQMDGFGASLTDASAWLISNALGEDKRNELMSKLFSYDKGIGMSFLRQPMGASDFAHKIYTYDDMPAGSEDYNLEHFSIDHDRKYIIPLIKEALKLNPELKIMATPWSPPAWMKTSGSLIGGALRAECFDVLARYFVSFIKSYEAEGIPIYAVTPQNEPLYVPAEYPGMKMEPRDQAKFIMHHLGPAFEKNGIKTKIIAYDHNWDTPTYPLTVLEGAGKYAAGSAWHCYGGTHDAMTFIHNKFPDKGIWFTEASGGQWIPPFHAAFADQMMHVIRATRNYAKTVVWWNAALDQNNGPTVLKNSICRGLVKIDTATGEITYNVDYYTMGHISKFVKPGAYRIDSDSYLNDLESVAFKNPDGSVVLIASNRTSFDRVMLVSFGRSSFEYNLPGRAAATFRWNTK